MSINQLILELKENNEDFEFYPTTKEMIKTIYNDCERYAEWLDIGCGTCNFKKFFDELDEVKDKEYNKKEEIWRKSNHKDELLPKSSEKAKNIKNYYVIEKSEILLKQLDKNTICLGTDFDSTLLIDKPVDNIFCNPPYSKYVDWTCRILNEANCKDIYMIIPQRWSENDEIKLALENNNYMSFILGSFDFLHAERQARAKVDVVKFSKGYMFNGNFYKNDHLKEYNESAFDKWFDTEFGMREIKDLSEWELTERKNKEVKNKLVRTDISKAKLLVDSYNDEMNTFYNHFKAISNLDVDVLKTIGIKKEDVKQALKKKALGTKERYWKLALEELDEITDRLTYKTRQKLFIRFSNIKKVDFTLENIYPFILWCIKNSSDYYNEQLLDLFKYFTKPENIIKYKSNQKIYKLHSWYKNEFDSDVKVTHITLSYRLICSKVGFKQRSHWEGGTNWHIKDICTIANNLGFHIDNNTIPQGIEYGEKNEIKYLNGKTFMTFRCYKNDNMHVKFDIEFMKAFNVEASRLSGWIQDIEDIKREFPAELAKGAEKYFKTNYTCIGCNNLLLTVNNKGDIND